ncbi:MAG: hypothetical protein LBK08_11990 [Treponema sp.]|nr:hypothetical protein [Treponema sp.]
MRVSSIIFLPVRRRCCSCLAVILESIATGFPAGLTVVLFGYFAGLAGARRRCFCEVLFERLSGASRQP